MKQLDVVRHLLRPRVNSYSARNSRLLQASQRKKLDLASKGVVDKTEAREAELYKRINDQALSEKKTHTHIHSDGNSQNQPFDTQESWLLEELNHYKPSSAADKRFKQTQKSLNLCRSSNDRIVMLFKFLLVEANRELTKKSLKDYFNPQPEEELNEEGVFKLLKTKLDSADMPPQLRSYEALLNILDILYSKPGGELVLPVEDMGAVFEMSGLVPNQELKYRGYYSSGRMVYKLKKYQFDPVNESQYITALVKFQNLKEAERLLLKRADKIDQRWWYELLIINYILLGKLTKAEELFSEVVGRYNDDYMNSKVFLSFIQAYSTAENFEKTESWRLKYDELIRKYGFLKKQIKEPGFDSEEEMVLQYLNSKFPPLKKDYMKVISIYLSSKVLNSKVPELVDFYLSDSFNTKVDDLKKLVFDFRLQLNSKIKPTILKLNNKKAEAFLLNSMNKFVEKNPEISKQQVFLDGFLQNLAVLGEFQSITKEFENMLSQNINPSSLHYQYLIRALLKSSNDKKVEYALKVLENLEGSSRILNETPEKAKSLVFPPVSSHHYVLFLKYFAITEDLSKFENFLLRIQENGVPVGTIILAQMINSYGRLKEYETSFELIDQIVHNDIHKLAGEELESKSLLVLYSSIWRSLKNYLISHRGQKKSPTDMFPDLRQLFIRMVSDGVIPTSRLYEVILMCFLEQHDIYSVICILQYMGRVHEIPSNKALETRLNDFCRAMKFDDSAKFSWKFDLGKRKKIPLTVTATENILSQRARDYYLQDPRFEKLNRNERMKLAKSFPRGNWTLPLFRFVKISEALRDYSEEDLKEVHKQFQLEYELEKLFPVRRDCNNGKSGL